MPRPLLLALLPALLLAGCAARGPEGATQPAADLPNDVMQTGEGTYVNLRPETHTYSARLGASLPSVWAVLPLVYADAGIPPGTLDPTRHEVGNRSFVLRGSLLGMRTSRLLDCGLGVVGTSAADTYRVTASVLTRLRALGPDSTEVQTSFSATATERGTSSNLVQCTTRGVLEPRLVEELQLRLR